jgi:hypothetical protein
MNARTEQQGAASEPAEEARNHGQNAGGFVSEPQRALLRPDDLVAEAGEAGRPHQPKRWESPIAHVSR